MDAALFDDEMSDVLGLLAAPDSSSGLEMDWLLDKGHSSSADEGSPPRKNQRLASPERPPMLPNMTEATRSLATTNEERLINVSSVSGSMAQGRPQPTLGDMSTISTSLAHLGMLRQCNQAAPPTNPPQPPPPKSPRLANASTISRNLASVGAAPQCNQRHGVVSGNNQPTPEADAVVGGGVVAEAVPLAPARVVAAPSTEEAHEVVRETLSTRPPPPRRRANDEDEKLRLRRARNREAAERMRRRRRDEREELQKNVRELTARVADLETRNSDLEGRLAAAEAENARLRGSAAPGAQAVAEAPALAVKLRRRARG